MLKGTDRKTTDKSDKKSLPSWKRHFLLKLPVTRGKRLLHIAVSVWMTWAASIQQVANSQFHTHARTHTYTQTQQVVTLTLCFQLPAEVRSLELKTTDEERMYIPVTENWYRHSIGFVFFPPQLLKVETVLESDWQNVEGGAERLLLGYHSNSHTEVQAPETEATSFPLFFFVFIFFAFWRGRKKNSTG